ncbi:MAG TPA: hypothetical protein VLH56_07595 [Dissulfurispiraceae bacterium]|nr:hypothetical protein [Dissulfurispiraceae bacterium]
MGALPLRQMELGVTIGWFWVPPVTREVYWSPGYVGWVRTSDYVGWVPLAPGEIYYGRGNYGRNSVNITNININQVNITNVYRNADVNNGATLVRRSTFATASPKIVDVDQSVIRQKIFTRDNISIGTPEIKPTRASYFSSDRSVTAAKHPPQAVRNVQIPQLKQSRPFIKEADKSVLNPGIVPKTLPVTTVTTPRTLGKGNPMIQQVQPEEKGKGAEPRGGPTGRGERQQVRPAEKKPAERVQPDSPEGGRENKDRTKPAEPDERPQKEKKKQGDGERER